MAQEFAKKFYNSKEWKKCRSSYILTVNGLCERCNEPGYIVHHKSKLKPDNINNPNITLNFDNLEYLCLRCHNEDEENEHRLRTKTIRRKCIFTDDGDILPIEDDRYDNKLYR